MKHEQLLVQYGMVRVGGLRVLELQGELEAKSQQIAQVQMEIASLKDRSSKEAAALRKKLRETELELQGRTLEALALKEKVRGLEIVARSPASVEGIERRFSEVAEQIRRVERLDPGRSPGAPATPPWPLPTRDKEPEH